ncbi:MAG: GerMN domain-containing protein [bacterium]
MKKIIFIAFILLSILGYFCYNFFLKQTKNSFKGKQTENSSNLQEKEVNLYFLFEDNFLSIETRKIYVYENLVMQVKETIEELINGPTNTFLFKTLPSETKLLNLYFDEEGTCYLNFSNSFIENYFGDTKTELITLCSLGYTLMENFSILSFQVLIEGKEIETLKGHLDWNTKYTLSQIRDLMEIKNN